MSDPPLAFHVGDEEPGNILGERVAVIFGSADCLLVKRSLDVRGKWFRVSQDCFSGHSIRKCYVIITCNKKIAMPYFLRNKYGVKTNKTKVIKVTMSIAPHIHAYATTAAAEQGTTFSGFVSRLIVDDMRPTKFTPLSQRDIPNDAELKTIVARQVKLITPIVTRIRKANTPKK